jgi:hypothetical protein
MSSPSGHRQTGGTCWFHAALNGLIMSPLARRIIRERIPNRNNNTHAIFWNYVRTRLERGNVRSMTNRNVIQSVGLRNTNACLRGGTFFDLYRLYEILFPGDYKVGFKGSVSPTFVITHRDELQPTRRFNGHMYQLSHAYIMMRNPVTGKNHGVAGFIDREGRPKIYDSATDRYYTEEDWTRGTFSHHRRFTRVLFKCGIYVRV